MSATLSRSPEETIGLGKSFASSLRPGDVVALFGTLGSGKTRFISGVCDGLGVRMHATSPTFTLINEYPAPFGRVVHIDLYRIGSRRELAELGIEEYFTGECICLIEWAEAVREILPHRHFEIRLGLGTDDTTRTIDIRETGGVPS